jgi:hypothetical protein
MRQKIIHAPKPKTRLLLKFSKTGKIFCVPDCCEKAIIQAAPIIILQLQHLHHKLGVTDTTTQEATRRCTSIDRARAHTHTHTIANNQQVDISIREEEEAKRRITKSQRCSAFTNKKDASTQSKG